MAPGTYSGPADTTANSVFIAFKGKAIGLYSRDGAGVTDDDPKNDPAAGAMLGSFIHEVRSRRDKQIPGPIVDTLIARAAQIIVSLAGR